MNSAEPTEIANIEESRAPEQLRLFEIENPLKSRFTTEFFKQIPTSSGVYWMHDRRGRLLYVGKAKNLRNRLRSYRGTYARHSSKIRRMLLLVSTIEWEETPSETAALLKENEYLRALKPPFNVANTKPETYLYLGHRLCTESADEPALEIHLIFDLERAPSGLRIHGAFKGIAGVRRGHASLVRWLWAASLGNCDWPTCLSRNVAPPIIRIPLRDPVLAERVELFLNGWWALPELVLPQEAPSGFMQSLWYDDQKRLAALFLKCAGHLRERAAVGRAWATIPNRELDDIKVLARAGVKNAINDSAADSANSRSRRRVPPA